MADDLKRVGLRFTADGAVDFKNSLKDISAATKENYTELKLAQSQYDKNTSSAQKLADKQKYLQGQTDLYKQKVQLLNTQLEEMEKAEQRGRAASGASDCRARPRHEHKPKKRENPSIAEVFLQPEKY